MLLFFYPFMKGIDWLTQATGSASPYVSAAAIPVAISLFHTVFNIINTFILAWFVKPIAWVVEKMIPETAIEEKAIEEPKFLEKKMLRYPETAIASLEKESKYLYKKAIFEIVAHALNIHRGDIKSDLKPKKVVEKSTEDFKTDVRDLYLRKVKTIYGEIIKFAILAQSTLKMDAEQNKRISEIKLANRKMVELIRDVLELSNNVSKYLESDNPHIKKMYDSFRRKVVKVLRTIYLFRKDKEKKEYHKKLLKLKEEAAENIYHSNVEIDKLIRKELITTEMASSLVNDSDNVNDLIEKLIDVADILYGILEPLVDDSEKKIKSVEKVA